MGAAIDPIVLKRAPHRLPRSGRNLHRGGVAQDGGAGHGPRRWRIELRARPHREHRGRIGGGPVQRRRLRLRADRELDRGIRTADPGQPGHRDAVADLRRADPRRGLHDRGPARDTRRGRAHGGRLPGRGRPGAALAGGPPARGATGAGQLQRRGRARRRQRSRRRRREHGAGRRTLRPHRAGGRRRRRTQRAHPLRAGRPAGTRRRDAPAPTGRRWCCGSTMFPARWCRH